MGCCKPSPSRPRQLTRKKQSPLGTTRDSVQSGMVGRVGWQTGARGQGRRSANTERGMAPRGCRTGLGIRTRDAGSLGWGQGGKCRHSYWGGGGGTGKLRGVQCGSAKISSRHPRSPVSERGMRLLLLCRQPGGNRAATNRASVRFGLVGDPQAPFSGWEFWGRNAAAARRAWQRRDKKACSFWAVSSPGVCGLANGGE